MYSSRVSIYSQSVARFPPETCAAQHSCSRETDQCLRREVAAAGAVGFHGLLPRFSLPFTLRCARMQVDRGFLNVMILSWGFMLVFTAFQTMGNIQASYIFIRRAHGYTPASAASLRIRRLLCVYRCIYIGIYTR